MRKEDYITFEVAQLLDEKGYDEDCSTRYISDGKGRVEFDRWLEGKMHNGKMKDGYLYDSYLAPSLYEVAKWLREKHQLHIDVGMFGDYSTDADGNKCDEWYYWTFDMYYTTNFTNHIYDCKGEYDTYEEALNAGIFEALKLI